MFGLIGKKLTHSFSKVIHEQITNHNYNLIELHELDSFFTDRRFKGINVTIPYKKQVIQYLDELSTEAEELESVNTIINQGGKLKGYNTDYIGLDKALQKANISVSGKTILILGNGSTSRTIKSYCYKNLAKNIIISARNPKENEYHFSDVDNLISAEIIFNATPVGMFPNVNDELLIDLNKLPNVVSVVDLVYNPLRSNLIIEAEKRGIKVLNGLSMLLYQAVSACELFHNITISDVQVEKIYKNILLSQLNLVVIGMPMSGKSFFAKLLSQKYNKDLVDLDRLIESEEAETIPYIFENYGESHFRHLESKYTSIVSKSFNQAISCGGGIILNDKNMQYLKHNGIIIFLDVNLDLLMTFNPGNRPLLKNKQNLEKLYKKRISLYRQYCDISVNKVSTNETITMRDIEVKINEYIDSKWS